MIFQFSNEIGFMAHRVVKVNKSMFLDNEKNIGE